MLKSIHPGFSERVFEFAFNAEYARKNFGSLAGLPRIPTTQEEKLKAYDVLFRLKRGKYVRSLFLQHKVSHRFRVKPKSAKSSSKYVRNLGDDFFKYKLDNAQYNKIVSISRKRGGVYYCAPMFVGWKRLEAAFMGGFVEASSAWIGVRSCPLLTGPSFSESHHIAYNIKGAALRFSSEPIEVDLRHPLVFGLEHMDRFRLDIDALGDLYGDLLVSMREGSDESFSELYDAIVNAPPTDTLLGLISAIQYVADRSFGLQWYLQPVD